MDTDVAELQRKIYLDTLRRCNERNGPDPYLAADSSAASLANSRAARVSKIKAVYKAYRAKRPEAAQATESAPPAEPSREPGPKEAEALLLAEALQRAKQNQIGQASAPTGSHKLEPFISYGSYGGA